MVKWAEVRAVGDAKRCPRPANRFECHFELSTCPQPMCCGFVPGWCAKPVWLSEADQFAVAFTLSLL